MTAPKELEPEIEEEQKTRWWGATVLSQAFAVRATTEEEALRLVERHLRLPEGELKAAFLHPHEEEFQTQLDAKFGTDKQVVKVIPFTMEPYHKK